jgi:hypothetical protein
VAVVTVSRDRGEVCGLAAWALDKLVRDVKPHLPPGSAVTAAFEETERSRVELLDLDNLDGPELAVFADALRAYLRQLEELGPSALADPDFVPGYLANITELLELVERKIER